jgi:hypothetical protein
MPTEATYIGSPLCQDAARGAALGLVEAGPVCGLSEESAMRWKPALNAFAITFGDRFPAAETY